MKKTFLAVLLFHIFIGIAIAQSSSKSTEYKILLTGASFASPQNGWFEIGCRKLNAQAINRAIGGEAIANTANRMADGTAAGAKRFRISDLVIGLTIVAFGTSAPELATIVHYLLLIVFVGGIAIGVGFLIFLGASKVFEFYTEDYAGSCSAICWASVRRLRFPVPSSTPCSPFGSF